MAGVTPCRAARSPCWVMRMMSCSVVMRATLAPPKGGEPKVMIIGVDESARMPRSSSATRQARAPPSEWPVKTMVGPLPAVDGRGRCGTSAAAAPAARAAHGPCTLAPWRVRAGGRKAPATLVYQSARECEPRIATYTVVGVWRRSMCVSPSMRRVTCACEDDHHRRTAAADAKSLRRSRSGRERDGSRSSRVSPSSPLPCPLSLSLCGRVSSLYTSSAVCTAIAVWKRVSLLMPVYGIVVVE
mmetsp:Transcript_14/g.58  ORF Transcript_14/g.58 Transcript_14/m.58 type:complete len:243 (-) Transcript_14:210-938(-)